MALSELLWVNRDRFLTGKPAGDEGFRPLRVALEALGFGQVVLVAPVAFVLEAGGQAGVAASAFALRDSVLDAPPAVVFAAFFSVLVIVVTVGLCDRRCVVSRVGSGVAGRRCSRL